MCAKAICSVCLILLLSLLLTSPVEAELVGWWKFDDGSGTTAADSSGKGNDGTLGGTASWDVGNFGGSLYVDGGGWVDISPEAWDPIEKKVTVAYWAFGDEAMPVNSFMFGAWSEDDNPPRQASAAPWGNGNMYWDTGYDGVGSPPYDRIFEAIPQENIKGDWVHWAFTKDCDTGEVYIYINGEVFHSGTGMTRPITGVIQFTIGTRATTDHAMGYVGWLDDFRLYDQSLTQEELAVVMTGAGAGFPLALGPEPEDGAMLEATWVNLSWRPGSFAVSHDLYFGTSFDDVNDGAEGTFVANMATTSQVVGFPGFPAPEGLQPGTIYYWRVDEVNDANTASPWKGDVWSFWVPPRTAYNTSPADGTMNVLQNVILSWTSGFGASLHQVYFGDNIDDVSNATGAVLQQNTTYTPSTLEIEKTYFWRVDEFDSAGATHRGDVWSFTTVPDVPAATDDQSIVGWWKLDEGQYATALDVSGKAGHGVLHGDPQWVDGYELGALEFDGKDDFVEIADTDELTPENITLAYWIKPVGTSISNPIAKRDVSNNGSYVIEVTATNTNHWCNIDGSWLTADFGYTFGQWQHVAVTYDGLAIKVYLDGRPVAITDAPGTLNNDPGVLRFGANPGGGGDRLFNGLLDDIVIYDKALGEEEIETLMLGDPLLAGSPVPDRDALLDIRDISSLSWSKGDTAASHDVYFGTDGDAMEFKGNQTATSLSLADLVEFGGGDYYWRIDEVESGGTVVAGTVWKFTVPDYLIVDDFEPYNDIDEGEEGSNRIYNTWIDGYGTTTNGAVAGNLDPPFMSSGHSGAQAMPLSYDNAGKTSEATRTLTSKKDWTVEGVTKLVIWFRGASTNVAERMFVALGNYVVYHPNDAATQDGGWNEWVIDLQEFADQGTDLTNVGSITLGFGTRGAPVPTGGTGTVHFDDIRLIQ